MTLPWGSLKNFGEVHRQDHRTRAVAHEREALLSSGKKIGMKNLPLPRLDRHPELRHCLLKYCRLRAGEMWHDPLGKHRLGCLDAANSTHIYCELLFAVSNASVRRPAAAIFFHTWSTASSACASRKVGKICSRFIAAFRFSFPRRIACVTAATSLIIYSPAGDDFVCVENQTCSGDAHNLHARGLRGEAHLLILEPGQKHRGQVEMVWLKCS